jgi:hypothetical protein
MYLTRAHLKIQPVKGDHAAKPLGQPRRAQHDIPPGRPCARQPARAYPGSRHPTPRTCRGVATRLRN